MANGLVRNTLWALGICLSLTVASLGYASSADARISDEQRKESDLAAACGKLQDYYDNLYATVHNPNTTEADRKEALKDMEWAGKLWRESCSKYGKISSRMVGNTDSIIVETDGVAPPVGPNGPAGKISPSPRLAGLN